MRQNLLYSLAIAALMSSCCSAPQTTSSCSSDTTCCQTDTSKISTPDEAIAELIAGNERFATGKMVSPRANSTRLAETLNSQKPFAAIVACSDSRIPVELLFDQGIGDIFVIRTAGNSVLDDVIMGSLDYAIDHLEVPVVIVLGHQNCGGITGAITATESDHAHYHGKIAELLEVISTDIEEFIGHPEDIDKAIHVNAIAQAQHIKDVEYVSDRIEAGKLKVISAYYNLESGKVEFDK